jgi:diacylglycerol kinase
MNKWFNSAKWAIRGIIFFFKTERNARVEGVIAIIVLVMGYYLNISSGEF